ncbi:MAG: hypothetical protein CMJ78_21460, partial [Planctomycetaceae bacterium]|nr:hypothetical protein [Planctomycetaceae bacterium]
MLLTSWLKSLFRRKRLKSTKVRNNKYLPNQRQRDDFVTLSLMRLEERVVLNAAPVDSPDMFEELLVNVGQANDLQDDVNLTSEENSLAADVQNASTVQEGSAFAGGQSDSESENFAVPTWDDLYASIGEYILPSNDASISNADLEDDSFGDGPSSDSLGNIGGGFTNSIIGASAVTSGQPTFDSTATAQFHDLALASFHGEDGQGKDGAHASLGYDLSYLYHEYSAFQADSVTSTFTTSHPLLQVVGDSVVVDFSASDGDTDALINNLESHGATITGEFGSLVSALVPIENLPDLNGSTGVNSATASYAPYTFVGDVDTQGDVAQLSNLARANFSVDGTGITIGTLSDSFDNFANGTPATDAADDVASNDLPTGIIVLDDTIAGTDEGRGMMQLIHDVAPGATQAFHTAFGGQASFAQGIIELADSVANGGAGADVIVDDVLFFAEPMFQDGVIAQAVDQVKAGGVAYFSSAGNSDRQSYESAFTASTDMFQGTLLHDFDPDVGVDTFQAFTLQTDEQAIFSFQWDQPFGSLGGAGSASDVDIFLLDDASLNANILAQGNVNNILSGDPIEVIGYTNTTGAAQTIHIAIGVMSGPAPDLMKYVYVGGSVDEFDTMSSTNYGHANALGAESVGAAAFFQTPAFGQNPALLEAFSSAGGTPILFDAAGNRLAEPEVRLQTSITAPDGGNTTFFGTDILFDTDTFPNFFGTSAAAPHAAAVAGLMLEAAGGTGSLTPDTIYTVLENTAADIANPGFDHDAGHGYIDANAAVAEAAAVGGGGGIDLTFDTNFIPGANVNDGNDDFFTLEKIGDDAVISVNGTEVARAELAVIDTITFSGSDDDDTLDVSFAGGNPLPVGGIDFNGTTNSNDFLNLSQAGLVQTFATVTHTHTNGTDGNALINDGVNTRQARYTGVDLITDTLTANARVFQLNGGAEVATLFDFADNPGLSSFVSTEATFVDFTNPNNLLTINAGSGDDVVDVDSLDANFSAGLTIDAGADNEAVNINAALNIDELNITATTITLAGDVTTADNQTFSGNVVLETDITLTGNNLTFGGTIDSAIGELNSLTVNSNGAGVTRFDGVIGGNDALSAFETNADGRTEFNTSTINLDGNSLTINNAALLMQNLTINESGSQFDVNALTEETGELEDEIDRLKGLVLAKDSNLYVAPTAQERTDFRALATSVYNLDLATALTQATALDYELVEFIDATSSKSYIVLREELDNGAVTRGWGSYILDPNYKHDVLIEINHPLFDTNTPELGAIIFEDSGSRAFLIAGAHRSANGFNTADVADPINSIYQEVHEVFDGATGESTTYSFHGFNSDGKGFPDPTDVVLSSTDDAISTEVIDLDMRLELINGIKSYAFNELDPNDANNVLVNDGVDGTIFSSLAGKQNVQGIHTRGEGGTFIHVELEQSIRFDDDTLVEAAHRISNSIVATNTLFSNGGDVAFNSTVDSADGGNFSLTINTSTGNTVLNDDVGGDALGNLSDDNGLSSITTNASGRTELANIDITTTGSQTFNDPVTLTFQTFNVDAGETLTTPLVSVDNEATLGGRGTIDGNVIAEFGGTVAPGMSPGILNSDSVTFELGSTFDVEIGGTTPGNANTNHDQLNVTGTVTIESGTNLKATAFNGFTPSAGETFVIINNDGADTVTLGNGDVGFNNLAEGEAFSTDFLGSGLTATISYAAGDGNDVALIVAQQDVVVAAVATDGNDDVIDVEINGNNLDTVVDGVSQDSRPVAGVQSLTVNGVNGENDQVNFDFDANPGLANVATFNVNLGGDANDDLNVTVNGESVVFDFDATGSGTVTVGATTINFTGVGPNTVTISGTNDLTIDFPTGPTTDAILDDNGDNGDNMSNISSALGMFSVDFTNPTDRLTINFGDNGDTLTIVDLDPAFNPDGDITGTPVTAFVINGGDGSDTLEIEGLGGLTNDLSVDLLDGTGDAITVQTNAVSISTGDAQLAAESVTFNSAFTATDISLQTDTIDIAAALTGGGNLSISPQDAARAINIGGATGGLDIDDTELGNLTDGFAAITIGRVDGTGAIGVDTADFTDPITLLGGEATLAGLTTSQGDAGITVTTAAGTGVTVSTAALTANGAGAIDINSGAAFTLSDAVTLSSTTGSISVDTTGTNALTVNGNVQTGGAGTATLTASDVFTMDTDSLIQAAAGVVINATETATVDVVTSTGDDVTISSTNGSILAAEANAIVAGSAITLNAGTGTTDAVGTTATPLNINGTTLDGQAGSGGFFAIDADNIQLGLITATGSGDVGVGAMANITAAASAAAEIVTGGTVILGGSSIGATNTVDIEMATGLEINDLGAGAIRVNEINGSTIASTVISVENTGFGTIDVSFNNGDLIDIDDNHTLTNVDLNQGGSSFSYTTANGNITAMAVDTADENLTINTDSGEIQLVNVDTTTGDIDVDATGNITATLDGGVTTTGGNVDIATTGGAILTTGTDNAAADIITGGGDLSLTADTGIFDNATNQGPLDIATSGGDVSVTVTGTGDAKLDYESSEADSFELTADHSGTGDFIFDSLSTGTLTVNGASTSGSNIDIVHDGILSVTGEVNARSDGNVRLEGTSITLTADAISTQAGTGNDGDGAGNITIRATGGSITTSNAIGKSGASGNVDLTASAGVTLNAATAIVQTTGTYTVDADSDANGTGEYAQSNASSSVTSGAVSITAATIDLTGTIDSGATDIDLLPSTAASTIGIGGGAGTFNLADAEVTNLTSSDTLTIGRTADGTGAVDIDAIDLSGETFAVVIAGGAIAVDGLNTGTNAVTLTGRTGEINGNGDDTADIISGTLTLSGVGGIGNTSQLEVDTNGANISFDVPSGTGNIDAQYVSADNDSYAITITHDGTGDASFDSLATGTLTINGATTTASDIDVPHDGALTVATEVNARSDGNVTLEGDSIQLNADVISSADNNDNDGDGAGDISITATDGSITATKKIGNTNAAGDVMLSATNGVTLSTADGDITTTGAYTVNADSDGNNSGTYTQDDAGAAVTLGASAATITAADVSLTGTITGTGTLSLEPSTAALTIGIGGGAGDFNIDDAEITNLTDGFASITIGTAGGTGLINVDTADFTDPLILIGGELNDATGTDITAPSVTVDAVVAPGQSPGRLDVAGNFAFANDSTFQVEVGGLTPGENATDHDQLKVTGTVTIGDNVTLDTQQFNGFTPTAGNTITIIDNDDTDAVSGRFKDLQEGDRIALFLGANLDATISYAGGDGNDVVLTVVAAANGAASVDGNGNVVINDIGNADNDDVSISLVGGMIRITDNSGNALAAGFNATQVNASTVDIDPADITGGDLTINGNNGDDVFEIDFSDGDLGIDFTVNGGANSDGLIVTGDGTNDTATYTPDVTTPGDGQVVVDVGGGTNRTITFNELEPVDITGMTTATLTLSGADDVLTVQEGVDFLSGGGNQAIRVSGTSGGVAIEAAAFFGNTNVVIDTTTSDGNDTITIAETNNAHNNTNLTINTGTGTDSIDVNGELLVPGNLSLSSTSINLGADLTTDGGTLTLSGAVSLSADVELDTTNAGNTAAGNDVTIINTVSGTGAVRDFTILAGTGGTIDLNGVVGGSNLVDVISLTGLTLTQDANVTAQGDVTYTVDNIAITNNLTGAGTLLLQPQTVARTIGIGGGAGGFDLNDAEIGRLQDGFTGITIGRADGTGAVDVDTADFIDPITIRGGAATLGGLTTSQDDASITVTTAATTGVTVTANLTANGAGNVDINSGAGFTLDDGITLSSTSGNITIDTTGANALTINGTVQTAGAGTVTLTGTDAITMDADSLIQATAAVTVNATDTATIDVVTSTGSTVTISSTNDSILEAAATNAISGTTVTLNAGTGTSDSVGTDANRINTSATTLSGTAGTGGFFVDETDSVELGTIAITGAGDVTITATAITAAANATAEIDTAGTIDLTAGVIGATNTVDLTNATALVINDNAAGAIRIDEITSSTIAATTIVVGNASFGTIDITFSNGDSIDIDDNHALTNIDLDQGGSTFDYTVTTGNVTVTAANTADENFSITATAGTLALVDVDTTMGNVTASTSGTITVTSDGGVTTTGGDIDLNSSTGSIVTTAADNAVADIASGGGSITLEANTGILDNAAAAFDLDSGGGAVSLTVDGTGEIVADYESADADAVTLTITHTDTGSAVFDSLATDTLTVNASTINNGNLEIRNGAGITVAGTLDTSTNNGTLTLQAETGDISLGDVDNILAPGSGALTIEATAGNITVADATTNNEINTSGDVNLTGQSIGATNALDITGTNNNSKLDVTTVATSGTTDIDVGTDLFDQVVLTLNDADADINIDLSGGDSIDITGADPTSTINTVTLSNNNVQFDYSLAEAGKGVLIEEATIVAGDADISVSSAASITLGDAAGTSINAAGTTANVTLNAGTNIVDGGGQISMGTGDLLLLAVTGVGSSAAPIDTVNLTDLAGTTTTGGFFLSNSTSGNVNITTVGATNGVSATGGNVSVTNAAGSIQVSQAASAASGDVSLDGQGLNIDADVAGNNISFNATGAIDVAAGAQVIASAGNDISLTATTGMILNAGTAGDETLTATGDGTITVTTTDAGASISLNDRSIGIVDGTLTLTTNLNNNTSNIVVVNATAEAEVSASGNVVLTADNIGSAANQLDITGDGGGDRSLNIDVGMGTVVNIDVLTDQFSAIDIDSNAVAADIDIDLPGADAVDINGSATQSVLNSIVLANTDPSFDYTLTGSNVDIDVGTVSLNSSAFDVTNTLGDIVATAGASIVATGAANISFDADTDVAEGANAGNFDFDGVPITTVGGSVTVNADSQLRIQNTMVTTTATADSGVASGSVTLNGDLFGDSNGVVLSAMTIDTSGANNSTGTASDGGQVTVTTTEGQIQLAIITTSGGNATGGTGDGGNAGAINVTSNNGDAANDDDIRLTAAITSLGGTSASANAGADGTVTLDSADGIVDGNTTGNDVTAGTLIGMSVTGIGVGDALEAAVSRLEADGGTGGIFVSNTGALEIGNATAGIAGLVATNADITVSTTSGSMTLNEGVASSGGDVALSADVDVTVNQAITSGAGTVAITADSDGDTPATGAPDGEVVLQNTGSITTTNAAVTLTGGDVDLAGATERVSSGTANVTFSPSTAAREISIGADTNFGLTAADLTTNLTTTGQAIVGRGDLSGDVAVSAIDLSAESYKLKITAGAGSDITVSGAVMTPTDGFTIDPPDTVTIDAAITGAGPINIEATNTIDVNAELSTAGAASQTLTLDAAAIELAANLNTQGGVIDVIGATTLIENISIDATNGAAAGANVSLDSVTAETASSVENLTINAGTGGDLAIDGQIGANRIGLLTVTDADDVDLTDTNAANIGGLTTSSTTFDVAADIDNITSAISITADGTTGNVINVLDIDTNGQSVTFVSADDIVLGGGDDSIFSNGGGGTFTIRGTTVATTIGLGTGSSGAGVGNGINLTDASVAAIGAGFTGGLDFGQTGQTGTITVAGASLSFDEDVQFIIDGDADLLINANLDTTEAGATGKEIRVTGGANSETILDANLTTDGGNVEFTSGSLKVGGAATTTRTIDTETGDNDSAGNIDFSTTNIYTDNADVTLQLNANATGGNNNGGNIQLELIDDQAGNESFLRVLNVDNSGSGSGTAGTLTLHEDITLTEAGGNSSSFAVTGNGDIIISDDTAGDELTIDVSSVTTAISGGAINWNSSAVSADATGFDLVLNASATVDTADGGSVTLGALTNTSGGEFLDSIDIDVSGVGGGNNGTITLNGDIFVDGGDVILDGDIRLPQSTRIDTEQGQDGDAGNVQLVVNTGMVSATTTGVDLTIDTTTANGTNNAGGDVGLGLFDDTGNNFLNDLSVLTGGEAGNDGDVTLHQDISLDANGGADPASFNVNGGGDGDLIVSATLEIDTEDGNTDGETGGSVDFTGVSDITADDTGFTFTIDTDNSDADETAGAVTLVAVNNSSAGANFLQSLVITANATTVGIVTLNGDMSVDSGAVTIDGDVRLPATRTIDTEQGTDGNAGAVNLAVTSGTVFATTTGVDLTIDTTTANATNAGGDVQLGLFNNAGNNFLNDFTINTGGEGTNDGDVTLHQNISLDANGADAASFSVNGGNNGDVIVSATLTIDTEDGNTNGETGGAVDFTGVSDITADDTGFTFTITTDNTDADETAGAVNLVAVNDSSAGANFLQSLIVSADATIDGVVTLNGDVSVDSGDVTIDGLIRLPASRTIDTEQGGNGNAGNVNLAVTSGGVSATTAGVDLRVRADETSNEGGDITLGRFDDSGNNFVRQLDLFTFGNSNANTGDVTITQNIQLVGDGTSSALFRVNDEGLNSSEDYADVIVDGSIDLSSAVDDVAGGLFDVGNSDVVALNANSTLDIDTSFGAAAASDGDGNEDGGNVVLGSITQNSGNNAYFDTVNINMSTTGTDAGDTPGTLSFDRSAAVIEVDGVAANQDDAGITIDGTAMVTAAGSLTLNTNPDDADQNTHAVDLRDLVIEGAGVILIATSGFNGAAATSDAAGNVRLGDVGLTTRPTALRVDTRAKNGGSTGTLIIDDNDGATTVTAIQVENDVDFANVPDVIIADDVTIDTNPDGNDIDANDDGDVVFNASGTLTDDAADAVTRNLTITVFGGAMVDGATTVDGDVVLPTTIGSADGSANEEIGALSVTSDSGTITLGANDGGAGTVTYNTSGITYGSTVLLTDATVQNTNGGDFDSSAATTVSQTVTGGPHPLTINTADNDAAVDAAGNAILGLYNNAGGNDFVASITIDAEDAAQQGDLRLNGDISLDPNGGNSGFSFEGNNVVVFVNTTIDTENGDDEDAGAINLNVDGTSTVYGNTGNLTLTLDARTGGGNTGGEVDFGQVTTNGAGTFLGTFIARTSGAANSTGRINLDNNITIEDTTGAGEIELLGRVEVNGSVTLDSDDTNNASAAGIVDLENAIVYAQAAGADLTINSDNGAAGQNGGNVDLGLFDDDSGNASFIQQLSVNATPGGGGTAGTTTIHENISLDDDGAGNASSFTVTGDGNIVISNTSIVIDTEDNDDEAGGAVNVNASIISSEAAGNDLTIRTATASATATDDGGTIMLDEISSTGGNEFLQNVVLDTSANAGTAGVVTLNDNISIDDDGAGNASSFTVTGDGNIVISSASLTIDTEDGDDEAGGSVNVNASIISADAAGNDLTIRTATNSGTAGDNGGSVMLDELSSTGGGQFLQTVLIDTSSNATAGVLTLNDDISIDDDGAGNASSFTVTGGGNVVVSETLTIDTEDADTDGVAGGAVSFATGTNISADDTGLTLTIDTDNANAGETAGAVDLESVKNTGGGQFLTSLVITADAATDGIVTLNGGISVDSGDVTIDGLIRLPATRTIDTEQGGNSNAGNVNLAVTSGSVSATTAGVDLRVRADETANEGGNITLGLFDDSGNNFVRQVDLFTFGDSGANTGDVTVTQNIQLVGDGGATALFRVNHEGTDFSGAAGNANEFYADVIVDGSFDLSSAVDDVAGGLFDVGDSDVVALNANSTLNIDTSFDAAAASDGDGNEDGGNVVLGSVTQNAGNNEYFDTVDINMSTSGTDAGDTPGTLSFDRTNAVIEVDGVAANQDDAGITINGVVMITNAGSLTLDTNPADADQNTHAVDLRDLVIEGAGVILIATSGFNGAAATSD